MDNKKTWLTILLAALLACVAAFMAFKFGNKPQVIETIKQENSQEETVEEVQKTVTSEEKEVSTPQEETNKPLKVLKIFTPRKEVETQKTAVEEVKETVEETTEELKAKVEVEVNTVKPVEVTENGVVVNKEHTTESTYKYVYTPIRFMKK